MRHENLIGSERNPVTLPVTWQRRTQDFYNWERRGRGWDVHKYPVDLEPPFRPIRPIDDFVPSIDDGRRSSTVASFLGKLFGADGRVTPATPCVTEPDPIPIQCTSSNVVQEVHVTLPSNADVSKPLSEQLLLNLSYCRCPVGFEIVASSKATHYQFSCNRYDASHLQQQIRIHIPDSQVTVQSNSLARSWSSERRRTCCVVDFGLSEEFMRPLRTFRNLDVDPLLGVLGTFERLTTDELGVLQVLFQPVRHPWSHNILRAVTTPDGRDFFVDAPEASKLAREKIASPLFATVIRVAATSPVAGRAWDIARAIGGALNSFRDPASNELIALANDDYSDCSHIEDLLSRRSRRSGMLLNANELVGLVHMPAASVRSERLVRIVSRSKRAPNCAANGEVTLGQNCHDGLSIPVKLDMHQRMKHLYVVGASGTGKSTFLLNLLTQDIEAGRGVGLLDPHGDLIDEVVARIPDNRRHDVILFDPADENYPIGFNVFSAHSDLEKNLIASDMAAVFRRLSTSWGDQMTTVLANAILAMLESERGGSMTDLRRFLVEKEFRRAFLKTICDRDVEYYWEKEFPLLSGRPQGSILTRLDAFLRCKMVRHIVAQRENRLNFSEIMNGGKIFLGKLAQGAIGEENAYLLGTLLVSKIHQIAISRQELAESKRRPFYLYIDEFHNFVTPSMASILAGVRKYRLGLVLAHQEHRQLEKRDGEVASAVMSNPYTRVCFRVGEVDARKFAEGFNFFEAKDLLNLGTGQAIVRVERADWDFNLSVATPQTVAESVAEARRTRIIEHSRRTYAIPRAHVESTLQRLWTIDTEEPVKVESPKSVMKSRQAVQRETQPKPSAPRRSTGKSALTSAAGIMGKGGVEHKYLQQLIKRWAEGMGYRATIEKPLAQGASVDVALTKEGCSIACEIAVTTSPDHEVANIDKCLNADFDHVVAVSNDPLKLPEIERHCVKAFAADRLERVRFLTTDGLFQFIQELEAESAAREHTVRGYRVRVKYGSPDEPDMMARKRAVSQVLLGAMSKLRQRK